MQAHHTTPDRKVPGNHRSSHPVSLRLGCPPDELAIERGPTNLTHPHPSPSPKPKTHVG